MNFLDPQDWTFPIPIHYGPGRFREIAGICRRTGAARPLVVTDRGSRDLPFVGELIAHLEQAGLETNLFAGFSPNPLDVEATKGVKIFLDGHHDCIIAIGGGSGMDGGKAVALLAGCSTTVEKLDYNLPEPDAEGFPPLICIPTTAGTGAETESTAMITDTERGIKICIAHSQLRPTAAVLDPELTVGLPANLTAWTGIDALVHAIEAYSVPSFHPLCDGAALEALRLIGGSLRTAYAQPGDLEARGAMLVGSCLAGVSFLKGLGLVHSVSHMVGAVYDTHHGLTNAIMLPPVLRFNEDALGMKTGRMARAIGLESERFTDLYDWICELSDDLSIPCGLAEIGVGNNRVSELARKAMGDSATATNPRRASLEQMEALILESLHGARQPR